MENNNLIIDLLDKWIEQCEAQVIMFNENNMPTASISSRAMAQAYRNVKQIIEVNEKNI